MASSFLRDPNSNKILVGFVGGPGISSNIGVPTGTPVVPPIPTNLAVANPSPTSVALTWQGQQDPSVTFQVEYSLDSITWVGFGSPVGTLSLTVTGLTSNTLYYFWVQAINSVGESDWSNTVTQKTLAVAPTGLAQTSVTSSSISVSWTPVAGSGLTYQISYSTNGTNWTNFGAPISGSSGTITGLTFSTNYSIRVATVNSAGAGPPSTSISVTTPAAAPILSSIDPVFGVDTGGTLITLTGLHLTGATAVTLGGASVSPYTVVNDTTITFNSPVHADGVVSITVTNGVGTSGAVSYTYQPPSSAVVFTTLGMRNGAAARSAIPSQAGHVFAPGQIPAGSYPEIRPVGSNAALPHYQWGQVSTRNDGSWYYAVANFKADGAFAAYQTTGDTLAYDIASKTGTPPYTTSTITPTTIAAASQLYVKLYGADFTAEAGAGDWYYADFNYILANYPRDTWGLNPTGGWELISSGPVCNRYWGWMCARRHSDNAINKWLVVAMEVTVWATGEYTINPVVAQPWIYGAHPSGTLGPAVTGQPNVGFIAQPRYAGFYELWDLKSNTLIGARGGPNDSRNFTVPAANFEVGSPWITSTSTILGYPNSSAGGGITQSTGWMVSAASGSTLPGGLDPNWVYWSGYQHGGKFYFALERVVVVGAFNTYSGPSPDTWHPNIAIGAGGFLAYSNIGFYYVTGGQTGSTPPVANPLGAGVNPVRADGTATYLQLFAHTTSQGTGNVTLTPVCATFGSTAIDFKDENAQPYWFDPINHTAAPWMLPMPDFDYATAQSKIIHPFKYVAPSSLGMGEKYFPNEEFIDFGQGNVDVMRAPGDDYLDNRLSALNQRQALRIYQPGDRNTAQDARAMASRFFNYHYWGWDHRTGRIPLVNLGHDHAGGNYTGYPTGIINSNLTWYIQPGASTGNPVPMGTGYTPDVTPRIWRHMTGYSDTYGHVVNGSHCPNLNLGDYVFNGDYVALQAMQMIQFGTTVKQWGFERNSPTGFPGLGGLTNHDAGQARAAGWDTVKQGSVFVFTPDAHLMKPYYRDNIADMSTYLGALKAYTDTNVSPKLAQWGLVGLVTASIGGINNLWNLGHMMEGMTYCAMALTPDFPGFKQAVDNYVMNYARIFDPNNGGCLYYVGTAFLVYGETGAPSSLDTTFAQMAMNPNNCGNVSLGQQNSFGQTPGGSFVCPGVGQSAPYFTFAAAGRGVVVAPGVNILDGEQVDEDINFCSGSALKDATSIAFQVMAPIAVAASIPGADPRFAVLWNAYWARIHTGTMIGPTLANSFQYFYEPKAPGQVIAPTVLVGAGQTYTTIIAATAAKPAGTTYDVLAGTYTGTVTPKAGDTFLGRPGAILDGQSSSTTKRAFAGGSINNVTIDGFEIKNYTDDTGGQGLSTGVFDTGVWRNNSGWVIRNCAIHDNTGCGVATHNNMTIVDCRIYNNQYRGILGSNNSNNVMVDNCDIYGNNTAQSSPYGSTAFASGCKLFLVTNVTFQNCRVYNNYGFGIWFDTNCDHCVIDGCDIHDNLPIPGAPSFEPSGGIFWEIPLMTGTSANNRFSNNTIHNNGVAIWLYSAGNVEIFGNDIYNHANRGIYFYNDGARGNDAAGIQYLCHNIYVHNNRICNPTAGYCIETNNVNGATDWQTLNNTLTLNSYYTRGNIGDFRNISTDMTFATWQSGGHDSGSTATVASSLPA